MKCRSGEGLRSFGRGSIGSKLDLIIPESLRQRHWEGYHRVMAEGRNCCKTGLLDVPAIAQDGRRISFDLPLGATRVARSAAFENQAFQMGRNVMGLQFHLETTLKVLTR